MLRCAVDAKLLTKELATKDNTDIKTIMYLGCSLKLFICIPLAAPEV